MKNTAHSELTAKFLLQGKSVRVPENWNLSVRILFTTCHSEVNLVLFFLLEVENVGLVELLSRFAMLNCRFKTF